MAGVGQINVRQTELTTLFAPFDATTLKFCLRSKRVPSARSLTIQICLTVRTWVRDTAWTASDDVARVLCRTEKPAPIQLLWFGHACRAVTSVAAEYGVVWSKIDK